MDRSQRMHNPNYPPSLHYTQPIQPSQAQPAPDPFTRARRDPFLAASSTEKREAPFSRGIYASNGASRIDTLLPAPAPPPPPSPFHSGRVPTFRDDHGRRGSLSNSYATGPLEPPPPPPPPLPSAMSRQMPPPAASPKQSPGPSYSHSISRGSLPNLSSFNAGRDTVAGYPSHRPSSSMSIQSIMGSDSAIAPKGPPLWAPFGSRTSQTGAGPYALPASPQYDRRPGFPNEPGTEARPRTPEKRPDLSYGGAFARPATTNTSPTDRSATQGGASDQNNHHNLTRLLQPNNHSAASSSGLPPRPFSQPAGPETAGRNQGLRYGYEPGPPPPPHNQGLVEQRNQQGRQIQLNGRSEKSPRDRSMSDLDSRKGSMLNQPFQRSVQEPVFVGNAQPSPNEARPFPRRQDYHNGLPKNDTVLTNHYSNPQDALRPRSPTVNQSIPLSNVQPTMTSTFTAGFMQIDNSMNNRAMPDRLDRASFASSALSDGSQSGPLGGRRTPAVDAQLRKSIEENQAVQRSILNIAADHARRLDRASPLPQAVQGAQSQPVGSNRDPSIKSEFGRMFSGLGSGVGSTPIPSSAFAPPTPANRSPVNEDVDAEPIIRKASVGSRGLASRSGKKAKRPYDDEGRLDSESGDGRVTPVGPARGGKRNKYTLPGHHHHHLPHNLHHHHIHRKADEDTTQSSSQAVGNNSFNTFKFPANAPVNSVITPAIPPHHHHHHPAPPHHHHPPKPTNAAPQIPALRLPTTTILTKPLVQSVSHLPRRHLGSQLYAPSVALPSTGLTTLGSSTTYYTIPNPLPRFEGRENCTFTIRVPRYYLQHGPRQNICSARRVWGTDVYTDDSDPVVAAIHSGWIKGAWGPDVDVDLLTIDPAVAAVAQGPESSSISATITAPTEADKSTTTTTTTTTIQSTTANPNKPNRFMSPPTTGPLTPPENTDLHLTLLILPPLEKYTGSVWHGIKSRSWGNNHDGVSFKIGRVEWVDEGLEDRGKERGLEARRARMMGLESLRAGLRQVQVTGMKRRKVAIGTGAGAGVGAWGGSGTVTMRSIPIAT